MLENHILIIEDDVESALWMQKYLEECNFNTSVYETITEGIAQIQFNTYDLILLDLNLPDYDGFELLKFINKNHISIPIIIVSAYNDKKIKLQAFKYGASDYMSKPIDLEELEARIWVHLNKSSHFKIEEQSSAFKALENEILFKDKKLSLTKIEFDILIILLKNKNNLISRENLAAHLSSGAKERSLDYHIRNIRKKIGDEGSNPRYLITEYGMGYKLLV